MKIKTHYSENNGNFRCCNYLNKSFSINNSTKHLKDHLKKSHDIGTTIKESSQKEFDEILLNLFISSGSPYRLVENPYYSVNQTFKRRI
jgi:hypothetical protein